MILECKVTGEQNQEKAQELLKEAIEMLLKSGGIKLKNIQIEKPTQEEVIIEAIN